MNKSMLNKVKINQIPINENNEPLIDLKNQQHLLFVSPPDTPLTYNDYTKVRKSVFEKLLLAQNKLPDNWQFRIYEGLRSLRVQKILFNEKINRLKFQNPHSTEKELFTEASKLVCPTYTFDGTPITPPHSTGGAVYVGTTRMKYACQYVERYWKTGQRELFDALYHQAESTIEESLIYINGWLKKCL